MASVEGGATSSCHQSVRLLYYILQSKNYNRNLYARDNKKKVERLGKCLSEKRLTRIKSIPMLILLWHCRDHDFVYRIYA